jgi:hypothetical protein
MILMNIQIYLGKCLILNSDPDPLGFVALGHDGSAT